MPRSKFRHLKNLKSVLECVKEEFPSIFDDTNTVWNMDETEIDVKGNIKKTFCASDGSKTGSRAEEDSNVGKDTTFFVTTSVPGKEIPTFLVDA